MPPPSTSTASWPASASAPVHIPRRRSARGHTLADERRPTRRASPLHHHHRPDRRAPAVAALLAVTSIPKPTATTTNTTRRRDERKRRESLVAALCAQEDEAETSGLLGVLMSPPDSDAGDVFGDGTNARDEDDDGSVEAEDEAEASLSSVSDSMPSLETDAGDDDDGSSVLSSPGPRTPSFETAAAGRRTSLSGREKQKPHLRRGARVLSLSSPEPEDCALSHPLLPLPPPPTMALSNHSEIASPSTTSLSPAPSSVSTSTAASPPPKSNLTLSLRALRSLRSLSRTLSSSFPLPTPLVRPDDFLTCSIPYTDERRPSLPLSQGETPPAETRRYLNPPPRTSAVVPSAGSYGHARALASGARPARSEGEARCRASIQLQRFPIPRRTSSLPAPTASSVRPAQPPASTSFGAAAQMTVGQPRPREARENPDFLRVIVLEMNMRRSGKLSKSGAGRARFALPARLARTELVEEGTERDEADGELGRGVPRRWVEWETGE